MQRTPGLTPGPIYLYLYLYLYTYGNTYPCPAHIVRSTGVVAAVGSIDLCIYIHLHIHLDTVQLTRAPRASRALLVS